MADEIKKNDEVKEEGFFDKVKKGFMKSVNGVKSFFVKTGRKNGSHYYGCIDGIGDFIVYDDHALISALGMDDVTFTKENVISYSFEGLGKIMMSKATVQYKIVLDDNVVFPELVRQKNDVKNLKAIIKLEKERSHLLGRGKIEYGPITRGLIPIESCDVYGYQDCFVIAVNLERMSGDKVQKYQEAVLYPFSDIKEMIEKSGGYVVNFNDGKSLHLTAIGERSSATLKEIKESI